MQFFFGLFQFFIHLDDKLNFFILNYGDWTYGLLFFIIFLETGLVVTPILPGDSLLFAAGSFSSLGALSVWKLFSLLSLAAILGDTVNYSIGHFLGQKLIESNSRLVKKNYLERAQKFYEKYGGKTIILARFVPVVRTFAPFLGGVGRMNYGRFLFYNIIGGVGWVAIFVFGGRFFGNLPAVKSNFSLVIFAIVFLSLLPIILDYLKNRKNKE